MHQSCKLDAYYALLVCLAIWGYVAMALVILRSRIIIMFAVASVTDTTTITLTCMHTVNQHVHDAKQYAKTGNTIIIFKWHNSIMVMNISLHPAVMLGCG